MDMFIRQQRNPHFCSRIDKEELKGLYQQRDIYTISLNDQLEHFYNKCKNNRVFKHKVTYFFMQNISYDLQRYQTKFHKTLIQQHDKDTAKGIAEVSFS